MDKISTEKDVFLRVAKKRRVPVERVEEIYEAFIKGLNDKILEEEKLSVPLLGIGNMVLNKKECEYYLRKGGVFTKNVEDIKSKSLKSLKMRYLKLLDFVEDFKAKQQKEGKYTGYGFMSPLLSYKAIHFYTSFRYHKGNYKGKRYLYTLKQIEKKIEEIFYGEDSRHN